MLAAVRLSVATVAVVQDYAERLRYANETITLIERARRQERRMRNRQDSIDLASAVTKFAPPEWVAARRSSAISSTSSSWPSVRSCADGTSWGALRVRDSRSDPVLEEHWDDPAKGQPIRALAAWGLESDEVEPGLSRSGAEEAGWA